MARCQAKTKDGTQCSFEARPGSKRCGIHGPSFVGAHKTTVKKAAKKAAKKAMRR